ncbi:hypothetical protein [Allonocardiopsis opalescens]|uniref:Uncharacterized protein n=1 Tax=Allonocardiopsis opalescens TaxID=1144618 RepID=A0A2T0QAR7_9ACTN|nr:hypothetical protein [Allonocardiopsis opalescens]PRY00915.1 hypothetical protein CLV72_102547 [Allonocardiopsis opalescens]
MDAKRLMPLLPPRSAPAALAGGAPLGAHRWSGVACPSPLRPAESPLGRYEHGTLAGTGRRCGD